MSYDNEPEIYDTAALWIIGAIIAAVVVCLLYKMAGN